MPWRARSLLATGMAMLVLATWAGLARIGLGVALPSSAWPSVHGPLAASGFFGTVIAVERAVATRAPVAFLAPVASAASAVTLALVGAGAVPPALRAGAGALAALLAVVAASVMTLVIARASLATRTLSTLPAMGAVGGGLALAWANGVWLGGEPTAASAPGWMAFIVLTVAAERVELARLAPRPRGSEALLAVVLAVALLALPLSLVAPRLGSLVLGASLAAIGAWLLAFDLGRVLVRRPRFPRFSGACLLGGSGWLVVAGVVAAVRDLEPPAYGAVLHAVFLGFGFSMVLAHAPTVLAAVARVEVPFTRASWLPALALHASVALRVTADLGGHGAARSAAGLLHAAAMALFVLVLVGSAARRRLLGRGRPARRLHT